MEVFIYAQILDLKVSLEKLAKLGIISGIILVGFVIAMVIVPDFIRKHDYLFEEQSKLILTEDEVSKLFLESPEYIFFAETFPDHDVDLLYSEHRGEFSSISFNEDTGNALILKLYYDSHDGDMHETVDCDAMKKTGGTRYHANDLMVLPFLKSTNCLD